jgi:hypothetical protein
MQDLMSHTLQAEQTGRTKMTLWIAVKSVFWGPFVLVAIYRQHRHTFRRRDTLAAIPVAAVASEYDNTLEFIAPITGYSDAAFAKSSERKNLIHRSIRKFGALASQNL